MKLTEERIAMLTSAITAALDEHAEHDGLDGFITLSVVDVIESFEHPERKPVTIAATTNEARLAGVTIQYVGRREPHTDTNYNTGVWDNIGDTKTVSEATALKMLRHPDVYKKVAQNLGKKSTENAIVDDLADKETDEQKAQKEELERVQNARDEILSMTTKSSIVDFIKSVNLPDMNELDSRSKLQEYKDAAIQRIDQYGLV